MNLVQQILNGLVLGHAYALVAIGWTLLLGVARLVNFGHGQMYMLGAFVTWWAVVKAGVPYTMALPIAMACGALLGAGMQRVMLRATFDQNLVSIMIMTLGFGYVIHGAAALVFGSTGQILDTALSRHEITLGALWITGQDLAIVVATIAVFLGLRWLLDGTRIGRLVRMVAEDPKLAQLSGVDEVIMTFVVVVFGGIGSVKGSYVAGVALGLFTALFGALVSPAYTTAAAFLALIALLVLRPGGLSAGAGGGVH